ncbi:MAG: zf-HC2 domain-containing protein [Vicinamibacterales bacterium]
MTLLACETVRDRLEAFHDGELVLDEQLLVVEHLELCAHCRAELDVVDAVRGAVRLALPPTSDEGLRGAMSSAVVRAMVEHRQSFWYRASQLFEDMHLVWSAAAATLAVLICVMGGSVVLSIAADERADSLAGLVSALATPGSNRNPLPLGYQMRAPHVSKASLFPEMLELANVDGPDVVLALATVVTQDGRVVNPAVLMSDPNNRDVFLNLLKAVHAAQFEPARFAGSPIAVNVVWLLTHTTVRAKLLS